MCKYIINGKAWGEYTRRLSKTPSIHTPKASVLTWFNQIKPVLLLCFLNKSKKVNRTCTLGKHTQKGTSSVVLGGASTKNTMNRYLYQCEGAKGRGTSEYSLRLHPRGRVWYRVSPDISFSRYHLHLLHHSDGEGAVGQGNGELVASSTARSRSADSPLACVSTNPPGHRQRQVSTANAFPH